MSNLFDRRRMLLGLAAASTAAASPLAAAPCKAENPALLEMAAKLPATVKRYQHARDHQAAIEAKWTPQWPLAPEEITEPGKPACYDMERTFAGGALYRKGEARARRVFRASHFRWEADAARRALRKKKLAESDRAEWQAELAKCERLQAVAAKYEAEIARIKAGSTDYEPAWKAHGDEANALCALVSAMMAETETTMEGLLIKAQALAAWDGVASLYRELNAKGAAWPGQIAASILRHARAAA